ncbi:hypothetical protein, partial [Chryseobacterium oncorhynchi]
KEIPPVLFLVKKWEWIYGTRQLISWLKFLLQIFRCSCSSGSAQVVSKWVSWPSSGKGFPRCCSWLNRRVEFRNPAADIPAKNSPADLPVLLWIRKRSGGSKMSELAIFRKRIPYNSMSY